MSNNSQKKEAYSLKELSLTDGQDVYEMLQALPAEENGFENNFYGMTFTQFQQALKLKDNESRGINLQEGRVPQTLYWFYVNDKPVGMVKLRHYLNDALKVRGGNIGYAVIPAEQGRGYATKMVGLALEKAKKMGIKEVLITCDPDNIASIKVIEKNRGKLQKTSENELYYTIST